jgi:hypothetical protein
MPVAKPMIDIVRAALMNILKLCSASCKVVVVKTGFKSYKNLTKLDSWLSTTGS